MAFFVTFLIYAALFVLTDLLTPKPDLENAKPAGVGDFNFPTASEGRPVPLLWGTVRVTGPNVVWWGDLEQVAIVQKIKISLFKSAKQTTGYRYRLGIQQALCRGGTTPVQKLLGVWIGDDKVFTGEVLDGGTFEINEPELFGGDELGQGGVIGTLQFFAGALTQSASSYLSDYQQEGGDTPGYSGLCYIAPETENVYMGNSESIKPWKFEVQRIPDGLVLGASATVNGADANPANVLFEIMTDTDWGLGIPVSEIDTTDFAAAGSTLASEGNGFSFILDRAESASDLLRRVEEQIDGVVFFNQNVGKWQLNLARADYDVNLIPELNATNVLEIRNFTRGTWEGTSNQVRIEFNQRDDSYKETFGFAQDMANVRIQQGVNISVTESYPGCKDPDLANAIAWRQIRTLAFPLAQAQVVVDRTFYDVQPSQVLALTNEDLGVVRLPVRVKRIDYGELEEGRLVLEVVQDIFYSAAGVFAKPPLSGWTPPVDTLTAFPSAQQFAAEAPRALTFRDPDSTSGPNVDKILAWARKQTVEVTFKISERHAPGTPAGAFVEVGDVFGFALQGALTSDLPAGSSVPQSSITVTASPDTQGALLAELPSTSTPIGINELGTDLLTLMLVGDEFMICRSAQASGGNVQLNDVYRGVLDTVQEDHSMGDVVWFAFVGLGVSLNTVPAGDNVDVKLLPRSNSDQLAAAAATEIPFAMSNRVRRPYPPSELDLNSTRFASTTSLEGSGSGESQGILLDFIRRDFRVAEGGDEIEALDTDAATLFADFPTANTTTHEVDVVDDPDGTPATLFTQDLGATNSGTITRLDVLEALSGVVPTRMRFRLRSEHLFQGTTYQSRVDLVWDFDVTSELSGSFNFGVLDTNDVSSSFTVTDGATDHDFNLSTSFTVGDVEYRVNGGTWETLITAGGTSGSIPNAEIANSDTVEIRHTSSDSSAQKLLTMDVGASTFVAHAVLIT